MADQNSILSLGVETKSALTNLQLLREELQKTKAEMGRMNVAPQSGAMGNSLKLIHEEVKKLNTQFDVFNERTQRGFRATGVAADRLVGSTRNLNRAVSENTREAERNRRVMSMHAASMNEAHSAARGLAGGFRAMWLTWGSIVPLLSGFAISSGIKEAVTGFTAVQYQMTFVKALSEDTGVSIKDMSREMQTTAKVLGVGAKDAADALRVLAQAGLDVQESQRALASVFKLAVVGETDVTNAALAATGVMHAFGKEVGQVAGIADTLVKASALSSTSVDSMMESMKTAAPTAHQFNVSLEDTAVLLTALAKSNITGSAAGTATKNMIKELIAPTSELSRELQKLLKFSSYDTSGNMKPIFDQIAELRVKLKEFDRETQNNILVTLFGERGDKAFFSVANMANEEMEKIKSGINDAAGFTSEVFFKLQQTVKGQYQLMTSEIGNTFATLGEEAEGAMLDVMKSLRATFNDPSVQSALKGLIQSVGTLAEVVVRYGPQVLAFFAIWGAGSIIASTMMAASVSIGNVVTALRAKSVAAAAAAVATTSVGTAAAGAATGVTALGTATQLIIPPFLRVISIVLALAGAYLLLRQRKLDAAGASAKELNSLKDVGDAMEAENKRVSTEIKLRMEGKNPARAASTLAKAEAEKRLDDVRAERERLTRDISGLENNTYRPAADSKYADDQAFSKAAMLAEKRKALNEVNINLAKSEGELLRIKRLEDEADQNANVQKQFDTQEEALQRARYERENPAGTRHINMSDLRGGKRDADKRKNAVARVDISEALEEYRIRERMARDVYKVEVKLANDSYAERLTNTMQYLDAINKAESEYKRERVAAEAQVNNSLNAVNIPAKDLAAMRERIALEKTKIDNNNKMVDQQNQLNEMLRIEQDRIKSMGDDVKYKTETLPGQSSALDRQRELDQENLLLDTLEGSELAVARAKQAVRSEYEKDAETMQREIDMLDDIIERAQQLISLGPDRVGRDVFENALATERTAQDKRGSKTGALEANREAVKVQQDIAAASAKSLSNQNKWNDALEKSASIASKLSSTFGRVGGAIGGLITGYTRYGAAQENIDKRLEARKREASGNVGLIQKAEMEYSRESAEAQISAYGDIMGAAKGFFSEHSKGYQAMEAAERVFRAFEVAQAISNMAVKLGLIETDIATFLFGNQAKAVSEQASLATTITVETAKQQVLGVTGVATQAQGDPYTAWARMAAMAATMAAIGIAVSGGGGGAPASASDIIADTQKRQGTGTVLGDPTAKSESIDNALDLLAENSGIGLTHTNAMRFALENIKDNIGNFGRVIAREAGMSMNPNFDWNGQAFGTEKGSFGFRTTTRDLLGQGITQLPNGWANLGNILSGIQLQLSTFQTVRETTSKWWGFGGTDTDITTSFRDASDELEKAVSESMKSLAEGILAAGEGLGHSREEMIRKINNERFTIGSIDFTGMSATEKEKAFTDQLSALGDIIVRDIIPGLDNFQKAGEGLLETAFRMATAMDVAKSSLAQYGITALNLEWVRNKTAKDLTAQVVKESIMWKESGTAIGRIFENLSGSASELLQSYGKLLEAQRYMQMFNLGLLNDNFINGAGGIESLASGLAAMEGFFEPVELQAKKLKQLTYEFSLMGVQIPKTKEEFVLLVERLQRAGGLSAQLAGRLLSLAPALQDLLENDPIKMQREENLSRVSRIVEELTSNVNSLFSAVKTGKGLMRDIDKALLPEGQVLDNQSRMTELWQMISRNNISYEQQVELAGELADLTLEKYHLDKENATQLLEFSKSVKSYLGDLLIGDLSPKTTSDKLTEARNQYEATLVKARAGDETAQGELTGKADAYLQLAREFLASSDGYQAIFTNVYSELDQLQLTAQQQAATATDVMKQELLLLRSLINDRTTSAEGLYNQQLAQLRQQLDVQRSIQQSLGELVTLPSQIAGLPAEMAVRLGDMFPGLRNFNPATGLPGPAPLPVITTPSVGAFTTGQGIEYGASRPSPINGIMAAIAKKAKDDADARARFALLEAEAMSKNRYSSSGVSGSFSGGKDFVSYDGLDAKLHYGERVLTNAQARDQDALAAEVRRLAAIVERLCEEQREHAAAIVHSNYVANERAAEKIVDGQQKAADNAAWKEQNAPVIR